MHSLSNNTSAYGCCRGAGCPSRRPAPPHTTKRAAVVRGSALEVGRIAHSRQVVQGGAVVQLVKHHHLRRAGGEADECAGHAPPGRPRGGQGAGAAAAPHRAHAPGRPGVHRQARDRGPEGNWRRQGRAGPPTTPAARALHCGCCCTSLMTTQLAMKPAAGVGGGAGRAGGAPWSRSSFQACPPPPPGLACASRHQDVLWRVGGAVLGRRRLLRRLKGGGGRRSCS